MNRLNKRDANAVAALLDRNYSARAIERMLGVSRHTVLSHKKRMERKQGRRGKMGRPALQEGEGKTSIVQIRVTDAEYEAIAQRAKHCKSVSEWIRRTCRKEAREALSEETDNKTGLSLQV